MAHADGSFSDTLAQAITRYVERQSTSSPYITAVEGLTITYARRPNAPVHRVVGPALCVVAQGAKWATFGRNRLNYRAGEALIVGIEAPSLGRVYEASPESPCLALTLKLDLSVLREMLEQMEKPPATTTDSGSAVFVVDCGGPLGDCVLRLVRLLDWPQAISSLQPIIMREMAYWLLAGPHGDRVARMVLTQGPSERVLRAMRHLRERFAENVRIDELASMAQLSPTAFHRHFKALVSLTPLQYQKQLRLLEARRLMASQAFNAEAAAIEVGYTSTSQFSREYTRLFGAPPKRDVQRFKSMGQLINGPTEDAGSGLRRNV